MEGGATARTEVIAVCPTAKPSYGKHIFWEGGLWKREASKELAQPESWRSCRRGTRGRLHRIRGVRAGFAPETAQTSARRGASGPLAEVTLETCHLREKQRGQMSLAAGRLRAGCGQRRAPGAGDVGGTRLATFSPFFFLTFCISLSAGALRGRALPSALRN